MYFAIDESCRNQGYDSHALRTFVIREDTVLLYIENQWETQTAFNNVEKSFTYVWYGGSLIHNVQCTDMIIVK